MKTKEAVVVLLSLPIMLCTINFCSKPNADISGPDRSTDRSMPIGVDWLSSGLIEAASEFEPTNTHYDRPQSPQAGITFPVVEGLSVPEGPLATRSSAVDDIMDLFNNPVGCLTSLADLADFLQKSAKSAVFQRKLFNN
jgi:hypothetical protein